MWAVKKKPSLKAAGNTETENISLFYHEGCLFLIRKKRGGVNVTSKDTITADADAAKTF